MYDQNDLQSAALCAWREARSDASTGMHAVLHVLKNRVGFLGFPKNLHDVIYSKNAFSSMSIPSDAEFNLEPLESNKQDWVMWLAALELAVTVLNTDDADPTGGAHYYDNPKTADSGWFSRVIAGADGNGTPAHPMTIKILHHTFYV